MRRIKLVLAVACMAVLLVSFAAPAMAVGAHTKHILRHNNCNKGHHKGHSFHHNNFNRCDNFNRFNFNCFDNNFNRFNCFDNDIDIDNNNIRLG